MMITNLIPKRMRELAVRKTHDEPDAHLTDVLTNINRAFDDFWRMSDMPLPSRLIDAVDVVPAIRLDVDEDDKQVKVTAEIAGAEESDLDVSITSGSLVIRGEKKIERESDAKGALVRERRYGAFERIVPLPKDIDHTAAKATFKNGVLTVVIPKTTDSREKRKHVPVLSA
jgi:HSP20 family protein